MLQVVLEVVAPVFVIIALGYGSARWRFIDAAGFKGLNAFTFSLAAPALLFLGGITHQGGSTLVAFAFFLAVILVYGGAMLLARQVWRMSLAEAGMFGLNTCFGNTVMLGIPLIIAGLGQPAVPVMLAILAFHSMLILGTATVVAEVGLHARAPWFAVARATLLGVARNPVVMAVFAGLMWRVTGLPSPPGLLRHTLELLGAAAPPVALFCLGGSLLGFNARGAWLPITVALLLKLIALPGAAWLICTAFGLRPDQRAVAVLMGALPTGANAFLLAQRYRTASDQSGAAVLLGTTLSIVTLSLLLSWLR